MNVIMTDIDSVINNALYPGTPWTRRVNLIADVLGLVLSSPQTKIIKSDDLTITVDHQPDGVTCLVTGNKKSGSGLTITQKQQGYELDGVCVDFNTVITSVIKLALTNRAEQSATSTLVC